MEFADEQVVAAVLESSSPLLLGERKLVIKSRVSKPAVVKSSSSAAAATAPGKASASSSKDTSVPDSPMKVVDSSTDIVLQKLNAVSSVSTPHAGYSATTVDIALLLYVNMASFKIHVHFIVVLVQF